MAKNYAQFKDIKEKSYFYTCRYPNKGNESDSLKFYKETKEDSNSWSPEFGEQTIHSEQTCWWYED